MNLYSEFHSVDCDPAEVLFVLQYRAGQPNILKIIGWAGVLLTLTPI